jgi:hypothetical protein
VAGANHDLPVIPQPLSKPVHVLILMRALNDQRDHGQRPVRHHCDRSLVDRAAFAALPIQLEGALLPGLVTGFQLRVALLFASRDMGQR